MEEKLLRDYARLLAGKGVNVEKNDEVWILAELDQPQFVRMVVEECYKLGAKRVRVEWSDNECNKAGLKYMKVGELSKVPSYSIARYKYMIKHNPSMLYIVSDDPDAMKGVNQNKVFKSSVKTRKKIKPYRDQMDGKYKWCIAAVPGLGWARKVFPGISDNEAIEKLWTAILKTSRVDGNDPIKNWDEHNALIHNQRKKLESLNLKYLYYKSSNGTDLKVELIEGILWGGGFEETKFKKVFNPNIPSEEIFTSPKAGSVDGIVYASKPLSYNGELIEDFYVKFENGKVSEVHAKKNQKLLEYMISMDEGAKMLGEVALVPYDSPIRESGILFYETLFDENAACHLALGAGFNECLPDGASISNEEAKKRGINDSVIHVDFMIGTKDLSIVGEDANGKKTQIFKEGNWAI